MLPTHIDPLHTNVLLTPSYPPLLHTWTRICSWPTREYPELSETLNYDIPSLNLSEIKTPSGFALPTVVRESYVCVDGQEAESAVTNKVTRTRDFAQEEWVQFLNGPSSFRMFQHDRIVLRGIGRPLQSFRTHPSQSFVTRSMVCSFF